MTREELINQIHEKKSVLCVGLDPDLAKMPKSILETSDPIFEFNKAIIDATLDYAIAYKPNLAFYEACGIKGLESLKKTMQYLDSKAKKSVFTIADAKRGDIGNTSLKYAQAYLGGDSADFNFDAITVAPYMGKDSVAPFLQIPNKWAIILALTSNEGSQDFQSLHVDTRSNTIADAISGFDVYQLFEGVLYKSQKWGTDENIMYVVGATKAEKLKDIRMHASRHFLLVPGVGAQGGSLEEVCKYGAVKNDIGLIINASRSILYASSGADFAEAAAAEAKKMQVQMQNCLGL